MGGYFSQVEEPSSPDSEEYSSTTQVSPLAKYFTFMNDPRSPNIISRTPILVQEPLVDPRSPATDLVERTPVYACASTPVVRYKLDNRGYEASPVAQNEEQPTDDNTGHIPSDVPAMDHDQIDDNDNKNGDSLETECEITGEQKEESNVSRVVDDTQEKTRKTKNQLKKRFNATQKSFLKTVLFKPYEELDSDAMNTSCNEMTPKKIPLGVRNDACTNGDTPVTKHSVIERRRHVSGKNSPVGKLPLKELSLYDDKENMA